MQIRIRKGDGSTETVPNGAFVELVDAQGKVSCVFVVQEGMLMSFSERIGGERYQALFPDVEFSAISWSV